MATGAEKHTPLSLSFGLSMHLRCASLPKSKVIAETFFGRLLTRSVAITILAGHFAQCCCVNFLRIK